MGNLCSGADVRTGPLRKYKYGEDDLLGEGQFGKVFKARNAQTNTTVALKVMNKARIKQDNCEEAVKEEVSILLDLNHPHVIRAFEFFEDDKDYYVSTELVQGGELFERICDIKKYSERDARDVSHILLSTMGYLHDMDIVHRDIKPENLLLVSSTDNTTVKVADFGFAVRLKGSKTTTACGTPGYIAPEILRGEAYGVEADIFSLGVVIYILMCGYPPFYANDERQRMRKNLRAQFKFHTKYWKNVSKNAKDLIKQMLQPVPKDRITARQALAHPWMQDQNLESRNITGSLTELRKFNLRRKFRGIVTAAIASGQFLSIIEKCAADFHADPAIRSMHEQRIASIRTKDKERFDSAAGEEDTVFGRYSSIYEKMASGTLDGEPATSPK